MESGSSQIRGTDRLGPGPARRRTAKATRGGTVRRAKSKGEATMQPEARSRRMEAVQAHPLAELLECPPEAGKLLESSARCIDFEAGEIVFRQSEACQGLYLVVSGQFLRRAERQRSRLTLATARPGELVELAAALGDGRHTYTLSALIPGSMLLLPMEALRQAFQNYPPLRMRLLEELAREVSRAYLTFCMNATSRLRTRGAEAGLE